MLFFQSLSKISSHFRPKYPKDLKMNDLEPNSKYFETFYQISCKDNKILKMSTRFGDLCLLGAILRYILEDFHQMTSLQIRIICVGKRQIPLREMNFREFIIPLDSGIFQSLRPSNILLHYFPKILIICLSTKPCFLSSPVSRFARSMFYFAVQVSAHLWAVSDRS